MYVPYDMLLINNSPSLLSAAKFPEKKMAVEAEFWAVSVGRGSGAAANFSFCRSLNPLLPSHVLFQNHEQIIRQFTALAVVKRSPKRIKYSAPRLTKNDGLVYVGVQPSGVDSWKLHPVVELLKEGAVGVIPTDTVYAMVCDLRSHSAVERLRRLKNIQASKPLSIICRSFGDIDTYTTGFPCGNNQGLTNIFRAVKHCLPGPYTFILTASKELPKQCTRYGTTTAKYVTRKNIGVRIPDDPVCQALLEKLDAPLIATSVKSVEEDDWILDPVVIADVYGPEGLDFIVDAGIRVAEPSTVVDMTGRSPRILRQGKGPKQSWMVSDDEDSAANKKELAPNIV